MMSSKVQSPTSNFQSTNPEFSPAIRQANIERMKSETFDVLVIGGGITGAGVARDAALRGLSVALVEKDDFASGTSSKTSRMVHGGLRYVAQLQLGVVAESCTERDKLRRLAPRLVWPTPFTVPVYQGAKSSLAKFRIGLWLYDLLSRFRCYKRHRMLRPEQVIAAEPMINPERLAGGALYYDCRTNDARLTLAVIQAAQEHGALVANHVEVRGLVKKEGKVSGAEVVDHDTGVSFTARARVVVNATGVWSDQIRQMDDPDAPKMMYPSRGSHIVLSRRQLDVRNAVTFYGADGQRARFALEWGDTCIVGTTDPEHAGDLDQVSASAQEVDELLTAVNEAFSGPNLTRDDVISTYAGVRPLVLEEGKSAYQVSRAHKIVASDAGLVTIAGGKLTTYRKMAEETVDRVVAKLQAEFGVRTKQGCQTAHFSLTNVDLKSELAGLVERYPQLDRAVLAHLALAYGPAAPTVLAFAEGDAGMGRRIVPGLPYIWAEVPYAVQHEMAITLDDLLIRRTQIIYEDRGQGLECAADVANVMARHLGWDPAEVERQLEHYRQQVELTQAYRREAS